jgi:exonuclease SbcC
MIPVKLTIEGLYSYQERQTIDFTNLTDAGLFGIFGATGSGKSSILEAISYALYGETERLNKRDSRGYNMMNLKSNRAYIEFDFYNHDNKQFRVTREFKRNSRRFDDVRTEDSALYELKNGQWTPVDAKKIEKIIGLSYDNFKRTMIIPQGQFMEFLELGARDRTEMMKDIFQLQRFDLQEKASQLRKEARDKLNVLQGKLANFESITEQGIKSVKKALSDAQKEFKIHQNKYRNIDEKYQHLKHLKSDFDQLKAKRKEFDELKSKQPEIQKAQDNLENYERISELFGQLLKDFKKNELGIRAKEKNGRKIGRELKALQKQKEQKETELEEIIPEFEKLPQKRNELEDLSFIVKALELAQEVEEIGKKRQKGEKIVNEIQKKEQQIHSQIKNTEGEIKQLKPKKMDGQLLREVDRWFHQQRNLKESHQNQAQKAGDKKGEIQALEKELEGKKINPENFEDDFKAKLDELNRERNGVAERKNNLEVQQKLSHYSRELHEGKPCPLCGSLEHPDIAEIHDLSAELDQISKELENNDSEKTKVWKKQAEAARLCDKKKLLNSDLKVEKKELSDIKKHAEEHLRAFIWDDFNPEKPKEFQEKQRESVQIEQKIEEQEELLEELRKSGEDAQKKAERGQKKLNRLKSDERAKQAEIDSNLSNINHLNFKDFKNKSAEAVNNQLEKLKAKNQEVERKHQTLKKELEKVVPEVTKQRARLGEAKNQIEELKEEMAALKRQVEENLAEGKIGSVQKVREILSQDINVRKERKRIKDFEVRFETMKNSIKELAEKLSRVSFSDELFQETKEKWEQAEQKKNEANDKVVKFDAEVKRLSEEYARKQELLKEHKKLEKRAGNLQTLFNLFKASGFVQYVSTIYLRRLCDRANNRFQRMSRNQLSLQMNEKNDFEIIDYLNEGKSRSVKTLSGGQTFQVSLSLALALAESIQADAKSEKNFFFIDEGFGTQDMESIDIIFETLLNLNKEDKVVGIISHVEALQDRIPMSLTITKDSEKGSLVSEG